MPDEGSLASDQYESETLAVIDVPVIMPQACRLCCTRGRVRHPDIGTYAAEEKCHAQQGPYHRSRDHVA